MKRFLIRRMHGRDQGRRSDSRRADCVTADHAYGMLPPAEFIQRSSIDVPHIPTG
jgi:hypothetical protein